MSDYAVGRGKPPRQHQFKPGNRAAAGRKNSKKDGFSLADILAGAVTKKMKIRRGAEIVSLAAGEIMIERLVRIMTTGTPREMVLVLGLIERHVPQFLAAPPEVFRVEYVRAEGSTVELPTIDAWKGAKP